MASRQEVRTKAQEELEKIATREVAVDSSPITAKKRLTTQSD